MTMEHLDRSFEVSLNILHPSIDPAEITVSLQLTPEKTTAAGPPRMPPFDLAFWGHRFDCNGIRDLAPFLETIADRLKSHKAFLRSLTKTGGRVELFCGIFMEFNWDEVLTTDLMAKLSKLSINLRLDAYAKEDEHDR